MVKKSFNAKISLKITRKIQWIKAFVHLRFFVARTYFTNFLGFVLTALVYGLIVAGFIICILGELPTDINRIKLDLTENISFIQDIVISQIGSTFLILSVVSFLAGLDNVRCYGERAIEVLFQHHGLFSIKGLFFVLTIIMLINLAFMLKQIYLELVLLLFIVSVLILLHITLRVATIYIAPSKVKQKLQLKYIRENYSVMKKSHPIRSYTSEMLEQLHITTADYIELGDLKYKENLDLYFYLLNICLFNYRKSIQEYHSKMFNNNDLISHILSLARFSLEKGNVEDALKIVDILLVKLNYYKVVLIEHQRLKSFFNELWSYLSNFKTAHDFMTYKYSIAGLIEKYWQQLYLYSTTDLSYCSPSKNNHLVIWAEASMFANYYEAIQNNKYLHSREKELVVEECLFEYVRRMSFQDYWRKEDIDDFGKVTVLLQKNKPKSPYLMSIPIALLCLKMHSMNDEKKLRSFLTLNLPEDIRAYVSLLLTLAFETAKQRGKRQYILDVEITEEQLASYHQFIDLDNLKVKSNDLASMCREISKYNNQSIDVLGGSQRYVYTFHPQLSFSADVIIQTYKTLKEKYHLII